MSDMEITTANNTATSGTITATVEPIDIAAAYRRYSDDCADRAMVYGCSGEAELCEWAAALSNVYAKLAEFAAWGQKVVPLLEQIQRGPYGWMF